LEVAGGNPEVMAPSRKRQKKKKRGKGGGTISSSKKGGKSKIRGKKRGGKVSKKGGGFYQKFDQARSKGERRNSNGKGKDGVGEKTLGRDSDRRISGETRS